MAGSGRTLRAGRRRAPVHRMRLVEGVRRSLEGVLGVVVHRTRLGVVERRIRLEEGQESRNHRAVDSPVEEVHRSLEEEKKEAAVRNLARVPAIVRTADTGCGAEEERHIDRAAGNLEVVAVVGHMDRREGLL